MRAVITLKDAVYHQGGRVLTNPFKRPKKCRFCSNELNKYGHTLWRNAECAQYSENGYPICTTCVMFLERWREVLINVVQEGAWGQIEILPKPDEIIRKIERETKGEDSSGE